MMIVLTAFLSIAMLFASAVASARLLSALVALIIDTAQLLSLGFFNKLFESGKLNCNAD